MAEIQDFAEAGLAFIAADNPRFDLYVARDELAERRAITTQDTFQVFFEHCKHRGIGNDGVLDDFGEAAAEFAVREGAQQFWIGQHEARRIERAEEIFSLGEIHAGLAADRTIHLRDDGYRHMRSEEHTSELQSPC